MLRVRLPEAILECVFLAYRDARLAQRCGLLQPTRQCLLLESAGGNIRFRLLLSAEVRLLFELLLALDVRVAPEELLRALGEDVSEHVRHLSLLLSHVVLDLLFF